nr:MAG: hypothetical protein [Trichoderma hamatum dsRNA virus 1]
MVDRLTGHVFLDRKPKQSVRHPRMMASHGNSERQSSSASSAERSALAQQTIIGRGGNLDSPVVVAGSDITAANATPSQSRSDQLRALIAHDYSPPRGRTFRNGECYKVMVVHEDLPKIEGLLPLWPRGDQIAQVVIEKQVRLCPGLFSLQFGGKWLTKMPTGTWPLEFAHVGASGGFTIPQILDSAPFKDIRLGGTPQALGQAQDLISVPALLFFVLGYLLAFLLDVVSNSWYHFDTKQYLHSLDNAYGFSLRTRIAYIGDVRTVPIARNHGCLFAYLVDCGFMCDALYLMGITPNTEILTYSQIAALRSVGYRYFSAWVSTKYSSSGLFHIACRPFLKARHVTCPITALMTVRFGDEEVTPGTSVSAPSIQALGGVRQVLTSLINGRLAAESGKGWDWSLWPTDLIRFRPTWEYDANYRTIVNKRISEYMRHFPQDGDATRLPERFSDALRSVFLFRSDDPAPHANTIRPANYTRSYQPSVLDRPMKTRYLSLAPLLEGRGDSEVFKNAQQTLVQHRLFGTNGKRIWNDWDAQETLRNHQIFSLADQSKIREYRELAYRLWMNYFTAVQASSVVRTLQDSAPAVADTTTGIAITHMNAHYIPANNNANPPIPAINPEAPFWDPQAQEGLQHGTKQFFDVSGMTREMIAALIGCVAPSNVDNVPRLHRTLRNGQQRTFWFGNFKFTFNNNVDEIFLHYGMNALPNAADQAWIAAHAYDFPDVANITSLIRALTAKLAIGDDLATMLDLVMHQGVVYPVHTIASRRDGCPNPHGQIYANGDDQLFIPRNRSSDGYFSPFFEQGTLDSNTSQVLHASRHDELIQVQSLVSHARAVSLNWAGKAVTLTGAHWIAAAGGFNLANVNRWIRARIDAWIRDYYEAYSNPWMQMHRNACATQYGFSITKRASLHESEVVQPIWPTWRVPFLANPYLELWMMNNMPTFQVLPYFDRDAKTSKMLIETDYGTAVPGLPTFEASRELKLSREIPLIPGRNYFGDGGVEYNAQFLVAQGGGAANNDEWRYEDPLNDFEVMNPVWSEAPYSYQLGQQWNRIDTVYLGQPGTPFADFMCPGTLRTFAEVNNKVLSWGFRQSLDPLQRMSLSQVARVHKAGCGLAHQSLMVNYISPYNVRTQVEAPADYSITLLFSGSDFAGMALQPTELTLSRDESRTNQDRAPQSAFNRVAPSQSLGRDINPVRVASRRNLNYVQREPSPRDPQGTLKYVSKYPVWRSELPAIPDIKLEVSGPDIEVVPPGQEPKFDTEYDEGQVSDSASSTSEYAGQPTDKGFLPDSAVNDLLRKADQLGRVDTKALNYYRVQANNAHKAKVDAEFADFISELNQRAEKRQADIQPRATNTLRQRIAHVKTHDTLPPRGLQNVKFTTAAADDRQPRTARQFTTSAQAQGYIPGDHTTVNDAAAVDVQKAADIHRRAFILAQTAKAEHDYAQLTRRASDPATNRTDVLATSSNPASAMMTGALPIAYKSTGDDRGDGLSGAEDFAKSNELGAGGVLPQERAVLPEN